MKRITIILGVLCMMGLFSCQHNQADKALLSREFTSSGWERFDFVSNELEIKKPTTYDLTMEASFEETYPFDYISVVFTVFDNDDEPMRAKSYKFSVKDKGGTWKSDLKDGLYTFTFPINSEMSFNEPGTYILQLENRMPTTPLSGIHHIALISK